MFADLEHSRLHVHMRIVVRHISIYHITIYDVQFAI